MQTSSSNGVAMSELLQAVLDSEERSDLRSFLSELRQQEKTVI